MSSYGSAHRKCSKCGRTRAEDMSVTYHKYPYPGHTNLTKAYAWAKYCWPNKNWNSYCNLLALYKSQKVLCGRHFDCTDFYDTEKQKLIKYAVPDKNLLEEALSCKENLLKEAENMADKDRKPMSHIENIMSGSHEILAIPGTSTGSTNEAIVNTADKDRKPMSNIENIISGVGSSSGITSSHDILEIPCTSAGSTNEVAAVTPKKRKVEFSREPFVAKGCKKMLAIVDTSKFKQLTTGEQKLFNFCKMKLNTIVRLKKQLKQKKKPFHSIEEITDSEDIQSLVNLNISNAFANLLQCQLKNWPKKPKGRRYNLKQKIMALVIYKKSPACYRLLRRMMTLPSQSCLNKLLNKVPLKPGINSHIFSSLKKMAISQLNQNNICIMSFDEMSIRRHLDYNPKLDEIQGFQDHGNHGKKSEVATKALVFMVSGIRKKWKQPIGFYMSHTLNADRMTVIVKEMLKQCFDAGLDVVATVCDLSTVNLKVLRTLGATTEKPYFSLYGHEVVAILDPPHLLKCTRNLLMKHDVEIKTNLRCNDKPVKGIAKWADIEQFYTIDKNNAIFVFAPQLTDNHIKPNLKQQMRVKLAAQVFSQRTAGGILTKVATNELPSTALATSTLLQRFDELFDAVNADSPDLRRGKKYSTNMTQSSPHISLFREMKLFITEMKYIDSRSTPPSQGGWIHTMNAIEHLFKNLLSKNIKSLVTRRLNQDPIENFFGCIRYNCGSNNNPTVQQFIAGFKTAVISNLRHSGQKRNCEDDTSILANNLQSFLYPEVVNPVSSEVLPGPVDQWDLDIMICDAVEAVEQTTPEGQACAYVCGFIFKRLRNKSCNDCKKALLSDTHDPLHIFISTKEYNTSHDSLNYANKAFITIVETLATIINNFLTVSAWIPNLKKSLMDVMNVVDFSPLNKCQSHYEINRACIMNSTFAICIKRYLVLRNRNMEEEEKRKAIERKLKILHNK